MTATTTATTKTTLKRITCAALAAVLAITLAPMPRAHAATLEAASVATQAATAGSANRPDVKDNLSRKDSIFDDDGTFGSVRDFKIVTLTAANGDTITARFKCLLPRKGTAKAVKNKKVQHYVYTTATVTSIEWKSSNPKVASISNTGMLAYHKYNKWVTLSVTATLSETVDGVTYTGTATNSTKTRFYPLNSGDHSFVWKDKTGSSCAGVVKKSKLKKHAVTIKIKSPVKTKAGFNTRITSIKDNVTGKWVTKGWVTLPYGIKVKFNSKKQTITIPKGNYKVDGTGSWASYYCGYKKNPNKNATPKYFLPTTTKSRTVSVLFT